MQFNEIVYTSAENILEIYFRDLKEDEIFVIVIGANNGELVDFLSTYLALPKVTGILVEPVSYLFKELQEKYGDNKKFYLENSAVYSSNRKKNIFRIDRSKDLPNWTNGLGSFNKGNLILHKTDVPDIGSQVVKELVNCITFNSLMKKYNVERINILQIDLILLEYLHLTYYQYFAAIDLLRSNNYRVYRNKGSMDLLAVDNEIL